MTNKKLKVGNVPNLRFPGFTEEWEVKKLGDLLEFKNGINASKEQYGKGIKFINVLDILNNNFITYDNIIGRVDVNTNIANKYSVQYGDILFQRSSETREEVGTANVYLDKEKSATFGGFVIRGKKIGDYNPIFFNKLLKTKSARESITSKSGGSTRYNVGQEILTSVSLCFPSLSEQKKISHFLSLIDERIQTQNKIIEQLETLIKGLSEKIFSQKIRFKEFKDDWEVKTLGDVLVEQNEKTTTSDKYRILSSTTKGLFYQSEYFNNEVASKDNSGYKILKKNQLVFSPQNLWLGNINVNTNFDIGIVSPSYKIFSFDGNKVAVHYCKYFLKSSKMMFEYEQCSDQGASVVRRNLNIDLFLNIPARFPTLEEQKRIVSFLSSIGDKIEIEKNILDKYHSQKQYLLQNLFI